MTTHVFTGEGLNINFNFVKNTISEYTKNKNIKVIKRYNFVTNSRFNRDIKYKILLRYIPHKSLINICSKIKLKDS